VFSDAAEIAARRFGRDETVSTLPTVELTSLGESVARRFVFFLSTLTGLTFFDFSILESFPIVLEELEFESGETFSWTQSYKTFYVRNLRMFVIS
jgi:hypothetical protein